MIISEETYIKIKNYLETKGFDTKYIDSYKQFKLYNAEYLVVDKSDFIFRTNTINNTDKFSIEVKKLIREINIKDILDL